MPDQESSYSRLGLFGDLPTRLLTGVVRRWPNMPRWIEEALISTCSAVIFLLAGPQRRAIISNLSHIVPDSSLAERFVGGVAVFRNFAWTYVDATRLRVNGTTIDWQIKGKEVFEMVRASPGATLLFTTHTGNYDLAGALFAEKFGRLIHTVRVPERSDELQKIRKQELDTDQLQHPNFRVHYNESEELLGVELARLLSDGEIVAIQCDRVFGEVSRISVPYNESVAIELPKGPMVLASISRCRCVPLYVTRSGHRNYTITFEDPLEVSPAPGKRRATPDDYAMTWEKRLDVFLSKHSDQWLVFEPAFTPRS